MKSSLLVVLLSLINPFSLDGAFAQSCEDRLNSANRYLSEQTSDLELATSEQSDLIQSPRFRQIVEDCQHLNSNYIRQHGHSRLYTRGLALNSQVMSYNGPDEFWGKYGSRQEFFLHRDSVELSPGMNNSMEAEIDEHIGRWVRRSESDIAATYQTLRTRWREQGIHLDFESAQDEFNSLGPLRHIDGFDQRRGLHFGSTATKELIDGVIEIKVKKDFCSESPESSYTLGNSSEDGSLKVDKDQLARLLLPISCDNPSVIRLRAQIAQRSDSSTINEGLRQLQDHQQISTIDTLRSLNTGGLNINED